MLWDSVAIQQDATANLARDRAGTSAVQAGATGTARHLVGAVRILGHCVSEPYTWARWARDAMEEHGFMAGKPGFQFDLRRAGRKRLAFHDWHWH